MHRLSLPRSVAILACVLSASQAIQAAPALQSTSIDLHPCLPLTEQADRLRCYRQFCAPGRSCGIALIRAATRSGGPPAGFSMIDDLLQNPHYFGNADKHQLGHEVGRELARHDGMNGAAFLSCPTDLDYGCQHGFFEAAMAEYGSSIEAAKIICSSVPRSDRHDCYHGIGHGLMMANAYRLLDSLNQCNSLGGTSSVSCSQGVFMENDQAESRGEAREDTFDPNDPLSPCDTIGAAYRLACYSNNGAHMIHAFGNSLAGAAQACLHIGERSLVRACIAHIGQFAALPNWQAFILHSSKPRDQAEAAWQLCGAFPAPFHTDCETGVVYTMLTYQYHPEAVHFCGLLPSASERASCFQWIGKYVRSVGKDSARGLALCTGPETAAIDACHPSLLANVRHLFSGGLIGWFIGEP